MPIRNMNMKCRRYVCVSVCVCGGGGEERKKTERVSLMLTSIFQEPSRAYVLSMYVNVRVWIFCIFSEILGKTQKQRQCMRMDFPFGRD